MCDNSLELHCKVIPSWLKVDPETSHGISIDFEPRFLFLYNTFDDLMQNEGLHWQDPDGTHWFRIWFETKWCPPEDLYGFLSDDENTLWFMARWYEPWCQSLGYWSTEDWQVYEDCPDHWYSDVLDLDVIKEQPTDNYIEQNGTDFILFADYPAKIQEVRNGITSTDLSALQGLEQELKEITEYFK